MSNSKTEQVDKPVVGGLYYVSSVSKPYVVIGFNQAGSPVCESTNDGAYKTFHAKDLKPLAGSISHHNELTDEIHQMIILEEYRAEIIAQHFLKLGYRKLGICQASYVDWYATPPASNVQSLQLAEDTDDWIDVDEELPVKNGDYLVAIINHSKFGKRLEIACFGKFGWYASNIGEITHWMHLPKVPK